MPSVDLNETDVVFVGFPLWYSEAPEFLMDCLKRYDFTRKKIIPLSTSSAGHIKNSLKSLQSSVGDSEIICPLNQGLILKDNFDKWVDNVKSIMSGIATNRY